MLAPSYEAGWLYVGAWGWKGRAFLRAFIQSTQGAALRETPHQGTATAACRWPLPSLASPAPLAAPAAPSSWTSSTQQHPLWHQAGQAPRLQIKIHLRDTCWQRTHTSSRHTLSPLAVLARELSGLSPLCTYTSSRRITREKTASKHLPSTERQGFGADNEQQVADARWVWQGTRWGQGSWATPVSFKASFFSWWFSMGEKQAYIGIYYTKSLRI